jgi:hypothetical protein
MPEHHNEAEEVYREAYDEAIIKAYYTGEIDSHTPREGLVNIGTEAGRAKLRDLVDSEVPAGERHFLSVFPGRLYTEVKVARDVLNFPRIEVGDEQYTNIIQQWGKQKPGAEQLWIYARLSNEQTWPTLPKYMRLEDGSFFSPTHTMTAGGKITDLGGENHILPDLPDELGEVTGAEAREVNNKTGHLRASGGNFAVHLMSFLHGSPLATFALMMPALE